ncbi:MAG: MGMT family protein [Spirochaetia bacterium]|nr:MGMT family protein [Spirochaetia bacterium]
MTSWNDSLRNSPHEPRNPITAAITEDTSDTSDRSSVEDAKKTQYSALTKNILLVLRAVPKGKVAYYGQIARLSGNNRAARQVVRVLHTLSEQEQLPWHRVISSNGSIKTPSYGRSLQKALLEKEGVVVDEQYHVDLEKYGWDTASIDPLLL